MQNKKLQLALKIVISCALTAILVNDLSRETNADGLINIITNTNRNSIYVFCFLGICSLILRSYRYFYALSLISEKKIEFYKILVVSSIRNLTVDLLPSRIGELSYFFLLKFYGISFATSASVFIVCFVLDFLVLAFLGLFILSASHLALFFILLTILFSASYLLIKLPKTFAYLENRYPQKIKVLNLEDFEKLQEVKSIFKLSLLTLALRLAKYSSLYILLRGVLIGANLDLAKFNPIQSTLAFIFAEASASLPASGIMGFGAYEKTWCALMNIPGTVSVIFTVHIISQLVNYFLSGMCCLIFLFKQDETA